MATSFDPQNIISTIANGANSVSSADLDNDGDIDVLSASFDKIAWYETKPVNQPPVATNDSTTANRNTPLNISVAALLANDTDPDNDSLSITGVSNPSKGTAVLKNNTPSK